MNRMDRLMATILLLQSHRVITAEAIAHHFEISLRTVYRDIAALSEGGVPIVAEAGVGYSLLNGFSMPPVMLTPDEASALFMGSALVEHFTDLSLQGQMRSALLKIRSVLPRSEQEHLDRLKRTTALFARRDPGQSQLRPALSQIQSALSQRRVLELHYQTRGEGTPRRREVEPLGLIYYSDYWHLIAYCRWRKDFRDFRTDRIVGLTVRDEVFRGHPDFSLPNHIENWRKNARKLEILLRLERVIVDRFRRNWPGSQVEERWTGDRLVLRLVVHEPEFLPAFLLSFGTAIEVLSPDSLRQRLAEEALRVARHHASPEDLDSFSLPSSAGRRDGQWRIEDLSLVPA